MHTVGHKTNAWYKHREKVDIDLTHINSCSLGSSSVQKSKFGFSLMLTLRMSVDWLKKKFEFRYAYPTFSPIVFRYVEGNQLNFAMA